MLRPAKFSRSLAVLLGGLVLVLATWAAYRNTLRVPFLLDDQSSIKENVSIRQLWPPAFPTSGGMRGRPVVNFSLALNHAAGGLAVTGYHIVNLGIHAAAALVLFGIIRRTLRLPVFVEKFSGAADLVGFSSALLWALHPLQTEAVTYLSQRTESLMGLFYLLVVYGFVRAVETDAPVRLWQGVSLVAMFLGLACKEVIVTAPVMVLLFDRTFVAQSFAATWRLRRNFYLGLASSWLFLAWLMLGLGDRGVGSGTGVSSLHYAFTESAVVLHYFRLVVWPASLVFDYGSSIITSAEKIWPALLGLGVGIVGVIWALRHRPAVGFLLAWPLLALAPTSSIVPIALQPMAEHRMYVPLAGIAVLAAIALHRLLGKKLWLAILPLSLLLGRATYQRNLVYSDEIGLWGDTISKTPENDRAELNLGVAYLHASHDAEAQGHFERALTLNPKNFEALNNLGFLPSRAGRTGEAIRYFQRALAVDDRFAAADYNLGCVFLAAGNTAEAQRYFDATLALNPAHAGAHNNLAALLGGAGKFAGAIDHYSRALAIDPTDAEIFFNRAYANYRVGRVAEAIADFEEALRLRPGFADARRNLELLRPTRPLATP